MSKQKIRKNGSSVETGDLTRDASSSVANEHRTADADSFSTLPLLDGSGLLEQELELKWLVEGCLLEGQPAVLGGPTKSLKSSVLIDLAISLSSGEAFLGEFDVPRRRRVLLLHDESDQATFSETVLRIVSAKGLNLEQCDVSFEFCLPQLSDEKNLLSLRETIQRGQFEVVMIDPLYRCLLTPELAPQASNLYMVGSVLGRVAKACIAGGATPILVHHAVKLSAKHRQPLQLSDLALAGVQEFARQWLLLNFRDTHVPGCGQHELWLSSGASAGFGSCMCLDIDEGLPGPDLSGRTWHVDLYPESQLGMPRLPTPPAVEEEDTFKIPDVFPENWEPGKGSLTQ